MKLDMKKTHRLIAAVAVGSSMLAIGCAAMNKEKDEEKNEITLKFDQAPAAVQQTLKTQANGAVIASVDQEQKDGKAIYEADAMIDGKNYEIKVAADGTLISKKLDDEKDEAAEKK